MTKEFDLFKIELFLAPKNKKKWQLGCSSDIVALPGTIYLNDTMPKLVLYQIRKFSIQIIEFKRLVSMVDSDK